MEHLWAALIAAGLGMAVSAFSSLLLQWIARRSVAWRQRLPMRSVEVRERILSRAKNDLVSEENRRHLWSATMDFVMTAESKEVATAFVKTVTPKLGKEGKLLEKHAETIVQERFSDDEPRKRTLEQISGV